ncbi:hypothetical protein H0H81_011851 [Sphagnurus paluster]|uniref:Uncharacterized protein n=1 Tax=Sphagnurus paluster TaxID=117069 RepID=A0A9P7KMA9_9AGAR|nr:hypothetical protein H0H81_011851 [Sphagnurus paluster]
MATLVQSQNSTSPFPLAPPASFTAPSPPDTSITEVLTRFSPLHSISSYPARTPCLPAPPKRIRASSLPGCPIRYLPLSQHLPDFFLELQKRQAQCTQQKLWWPCNKAPTHLASPVILSSRGALPQDSETAHLQNEIEAAMAEPMDKKPRNFIPQSADALNHTIKTSSTHPIK